MRVIHLESDYSGFAELLKIAQQEPLLLLTTDGQEYILSQADDFEKEVEILRHSEKFQAFLEQRRKSGKRVSLEEMEKFI
jgi:hypothetical protein